MVAKRNFRSAPSRNSGPSYSDRRRAMLDQFTPAKRSDGANQSGGKSDSDNDGDESTTSTSSGVAPSMVVPTLGLRGGGMPNIRRLRSTPKTTTLKAKTVQEALQRKSRASRVGMSAEERCLSLTTVYVNIGTSMDTQALGPRDEAN